MDQYGCDIYIPPNLLAPHHQNILKSLTNHLDSLMKAYPDTKFVIGGTLTIFQPLCFTSYVLTESTPRIEETE